MRSLHLHEFLGCNQTRLGFIHSQARMLIVQSNPWMLTPQCYTHGPYPGSRAALELCNLFFGLMNLDLRFICTRKKTDQASFCPFRLRKVFVSTKLASGYLHCLQFAAFVDQKLIQKSTQHIDSCPVYVSISFSCAFHVLTPPHCTSNKKMFLLQYLEPHCSSTKKIFFLQYLEY